MSERPSSPLPAAPRRLRAARLLPGLCLLALLDACQREMPDTERPPEPQATTHTELRDAIQQPLDKARAVEQTLQQAADQQRKQVDAAEAD